MCTTWTITNKYLSGYTTQMAPTSSSEIKCQTEGVWVLDFKGFQKKNSHFFTFLLKEVCFCLPCTTCIAC